MIINKVNVINFKSNPEREAQLEKLRKLKLEELRKRKENDLLEKISSYPDLENQVSRKVAGFLTQFTCSIQNNSEHNIMEFFGDEKTAQNLRGKLSPKCQAESKELRDEIQKFEELKDPVMTLICANKLKKFAPREGILSKEQYTNLVEGLKNTVSTIVRNANLDQFEAEDKAAILELVQKVEQSESVDFGIESKLRVLVDRLNSKKFKPNFIPPVRIRELGKKLL